MSIIEINRNISATTASVNFFAALKTAGKAPLNGGQGRELVEAPEDLFRAPQSFGIGSGYNPAVGGTDAFRAAAAEWLQRYLNIQGSDKSTFVISMNGRAALVGSLSHIGFTRMNAGGNPNQLVVAIPEYGWPMYDSIVKRTLFTPMVKYDVGNGTCLTESFKESLCDGKIDVVVTNSPQNATGTIYTSNYMQELGGLLEDLNKKRMERKETPISHILDIPYIQALPDGKKSYLSGAYDHLTNPNGVTPYYAAVSFSKALGTATPGLTITSVHPSLAGDFKTHLTETGAGISYNPDFFDACKEVLAPKNDSLILSHFRAMRDKYTANRATLCAALEEAVLPGAPMMTSLLSLPKEDYTGRLLTYGKGEIRPCHTGWDIVEFLGNGSFNNGNGVVLVPNGTKDENILVRIAQAQQPDVFKELVRRTAQGLEAIKNAPRIAPTL